MLRNEMVRSFDHSSVNLGAARGPGGLSNPASWRWVVGRGGRNTSLNYHKRPASCERDIAAGLAHVPSFTSSL